MVVMEKISTNEKIKKSKNKKLNLELEVLLLESYQNIEEKFGIILNSKIREKTKFEEENKI